MGQSTLQHHLVACMYLPFLSLTASSKSEGSPSQRLENAAKKPEDKREVFRPLKPAVRRAQPRAPSGRGEIFLL